VLPWYFIKLALVKITKLKTTKKHLNIGKAM
jgi:hypothetical protein